MNERTLPILFLIILLGASCSFLLGPKAPPARHPSPSPRATVHSPLPSPSLSPIPPTPTRTVLHFLTPTVTPGPLRVRISDGDALALLSGTDELPVTYVQVRIHFREDGRVDVWAQNVRYGAVRLNHLHIRGHMDLFGCIPQLHMDAWEPHDPAVLLISTLINRSLRRSVHGYCVERIIPREGEMILLLGQGTPESIR